MLAMWFPAGVTARGSAHGWATTRSPSKVLTAPVWPVEGLGHHLVRIEEGPLQTQRLQHLLGQRLQIGLASDGLDDPTGGDEGGVVVAEVLAQRRDLRILGQLLHVESDRVIAVAGIGKDIAQPAGGVVQELTDRDRLGNRLVCDLELGQIGADRRIEVDQAGVHQPHDRGRRVRLANGADLKQGLRIDLQWVIDVGDAEAGAVLLAAGDDADRDARYLEGDQPFLDRGVQLGDKRVELAAIPKLRGLARGPANVP